jgi:hypothetical protein
MTARWKPRARRTLAIAWHVAAFVLLAAGFVPLAVLCMLFDATRGRPWIATRTLLVVFWYLACEVTGLVAALAVAATGATAWRSSPERTADAYRKLGDRWTEMLANGAIRIFGVRSSLGHAPERLGERPLIVFVRRTGKADAVVATLALRAHGLRLHYVLDEDLLWDPFVDIVARRLPSVFVRADSTYGARDAARLRALATRLAPGHALVVHGEPDRYTPARKARAVARLRDEGSDRAAREASWLRHMLPPAPQRIGFLLDAAPRADVAFLAHAGLESLTSVPRYLGGGLIGARVHAVLAVARVEEIPKTPESRHPWIMRYWREMDRLVDDHQPPHGRRLHASRTERPA